MINIYDSTQIHIYGLELRNSPSFFVRLGNTNSVHIHDLEINTAVIKQRGSMLRGEQIDFGLPANLSQFEKAVFNLTVLALNQYLDEMPEAVKDGVRSYLGAAPVFSWPTFPLNTDGIDIGGSNVLIENNKIKNYDDSVVPKPSHGKNDYLVKDRCTQDFLVRNITVMFGVGMSIGSVYSDYDNECVRDITFMDVDFEYPLKAVYVKTNPCAAYYTAEECA